MSFHCCWHRNGWFYIRARQVEGDSFVELRFLQAEGVNSAQNRLPETGFFPISANIIINENTWRCSQFSFGFKMMGLACV